MASGQASPVKPSLWQPWINIAAAMIRGSRSILLYWIFPKHSILYPTKNCFTKQLNNYGIIGPLHSWTEYFLCDRHMKVMIDGKTFQEAKVTSGVLQGTRLKTDTVSLLHQKFA